MSDQLNERENNIRENCDKILGMIWTNPTEKVQLWMDSFMTMRILLERELADSLKQSGKTDKEIAAALDKIAGRGKWIAEMKSRMNKQSTERNKDNKKSYSVRSASK